ncbi:MAG: hypothetical protein HUK03_03845, partial [Bacteroidaceae bacterium]|nr:hypothetical protein [Bacteroidaceae bacterium]
DDESIKPVKGEPTTNNISLGRDKAWRVPAGTWSVTLNTNDQSFTYDDPKLNISVSYNEDCSVAVATVTGTDPTAEMYYTIDAQETEPEYQLYEGPVTLTWMEARADEFGICNYFLGVIEGKFNEETMQFDTLSVGFEQISLSKPLPEPEPIINVTYSEDYSSAKVFVQGTKEDTQLFYTIDAQETEPEYMLYEGPVTLAWMEARADEFGICVYNFGVLEGTFNEETGAFDTISVGFEQISLTKPAPEPEPIINVNYSPDCSSAKVFVQGTEDDTMLFYTLDAQEGEEAEYQLYEGPVTVAYMESRAEFGVCNYFFGVIEARYNEETEKLDTVSVGFEQITLQKPIEPEFDADKTYVINNKVKTDAYMQDNEGTRVDCYAKNDNSYWRLIATPNVNCYYIQNATTNRYLQAHGDATEVELAMGDEPVEYYIERRDEEDAWGIACTEASVYDFNAGCVGLNLKKDPTEEGCCLQTYAAVAGTNHRSFWTITEEEQPTAINAVKSVDDSKEIYTVSGMKTSKAQRGINIVIGADGKVSKVLKK